MSLCSPEHCCVLKMKEALSLYVSALSRELHFLPYCVPAAERIDLDTWQGQR